MARSRSRVQCAVAYEANVRLGVELSMQPARSARRLVYIIRRRRTSAISRFTDAASSVQPYSLVMKVFLSLTLLAAVAFAEPPLYRQQGQQQRYLFARQQEEASGPYAPSGWRPDGPAFNLPQRQQKQQQQVDNGYGPPQQPQEPQQQYGPPQQPQQPQQQYGPPQQPQQQYGPPQQPQQPQQQYGGPQSQNGRLQVQVFRPQQFGRQQQQQQQQYPSNPQQQYGAPPAQYGAPDYTTTELPSATEIDEPITESSFGESEPEQLGSSNEFEEDADLDGNQSRQAKQQQERGEYYVALPDGRLQRVRYVSRQDLEAMRYFAKIRAENVEPLRGPIYAYSPLQKLEVAPGNLQVAVAPAVEPATLTVTAAERKPEKLQQPKVDIKPLAQLQIQHDNPAPVVPLSTSYTTYTANYRVPAVPLEERYILALPSA